VVDQAEFARYDRDAALLLRPGTPVPDDVTHVGFYVDGAIQGVVPRIEGDHPHLLFDARTAEGLAATGQPADARAAEVIQRVITADADQAGRTFRMLVLSAPDSPDTVRLAAPIRNTKTAGPSSRPLAWAVAPRVVPVAQLTSGIETIDELDALDALNTDGGAPP
jgi:hypothetical protein